MSFMDIQQYDCLGLFLKVGILYVLTELAGVHNGMRGTCLGVFLNPQATAEVPSTRLKY